MKKDKKPFEYNLPDRVTHEEYQKEVKVRSIFDKCVGGFLYISGLLSIISVFLGAITGFGKYTGSPVTDLIVFLFLLILGFFSIYQGRFMWTRFLCRHCLATVPEGSTYCPSCSADLLSNKNPQTPN